MLYSCVRSSLFIICTYFLEFLKTQEILKTKSVSNNEKSENLKIKCSLFFKQRKKYRYLVKGNTLNLIGIKY